MRLRSALRTMCSNRAGREPSLTTSLPSASVSFLGQPAAMRCASNGSMRDKSSDLVRPRVSSGCRGDLTTPGGLPLDQICTTQGIIPQSLCMDWKCLPAVMAVATQRCNISALAEVVDGMKGLYLNRICHMTAVVGRTITKQVNLCHLGSPIYPAANGAHSSSCMGLVHYLCHVAVLIFNSNPVNQVALSC